MGFSAGKIEAKFRENFTGRGELGAAVSIWRDGEEVLHLAAGKTGREDESDWTAKTMVPVWSATKGPAAAAVLLALHEAGISPDSPVADLWPELKAARSADLSFARLLAHRSGLAGLAPDNRPSILQHREVVEALEKQEPFWQPNFHHGYHPRTFGALTDEIVRRATGGQTLGEFWKFRFADPLELDLRIGNLSPADLERLAVISPPKTLNPTPQEAAFFDELNDPESLSVAAFSSPAGIRRLGDINDSDYLQAGLPSLGGVASARGLAKFYAVLANRGIWKGDQFLPESLAESFSVPISSGRDLVFILPTAFSCGMMLDPLDSANGVKVRQVFGPSIRAYGHPGAGGSLAFADPDKAIAFAYVMNQMETGILPNEKALGLVTQLYEDNEG